LRKLGELSFRRGSKRKRELSSPDKKRLAVIHWGGDKKGGKAIIRNRRDRKNSAKTGVESGRATEGNETNFGGGWRREKGEKLPRESKKVVSDQGGFDVWRGNALAWGDKTGHKGKPSQRRRQE